MACNCGFEGYLANGLPSHSANIHRLPETYRRKQGEGEQGGDPDAGHVHEYTLPDGSAGFTGPPVAAGGSDSGGAGLAPPSEGTAPSAPGALRAPGSKATVETPPVADDLARVQAALVAGRVDLLPASGAEIYDRMLQSGGRFFGNDPKKRDYIERVAWRAVRQSYGLEADAPGSDVPRGTPSPASMPSAMRAPAYGRKYVLSGGTVPRPAGGGFVIQIAEAENPEAVRRGGVARDGWEYERIDSLPIPGSPGALVRVGMAPNARVNILDVTVPKSLVSSDESGAGAMEWVRTHWKTIVNLAHGEYWRDGVPTAKRLVKFVTTPEKAAERIAYGAVYVPWEVDLQGQYATAETVRKMAHRFMERRGVPKDMHAVRHMKDGGRPYEIIESFVSRDGDTHFPIPGSWVIGARFHPDVWEDVKRGGRQGYSIGGRWGRYALLPAVVAEALEAAA
jgi:hypothetical protein